MQFLFSGNIMCILLLVCCRYAAGVLPGAAGVLLVFCWCSASVPVCYRWRCDLPVCCRPVCFRCSAGVFPVLCQCVSGVLPVFCRCFAGVLPVCCRCAVSGSVGSNGTANDEWQQTNDDDKLRQQTTHDNQWQQELMTNGQQWRMATTNDDDNEDNHDNDDKRRRWRVGRGNGGFTQQSNGYLYLVRAAEYNIWFSECMPSANTKVVLFCDISKDIYI